MGLGIGGMMIVFRADCLARFFIQKASSQRVADSPRPKTRTRACRATKLTSSAEDDWIDETELPDAEEGRVSTADLESELPEAEEGRVSTADLPNKSRQASE